MRRVYQVIGSGLISFSVCLTVQAQTEEQCQKMLNRFSGLQRYVIKEGPTEVPNMKVGLTEKELKALIDKKNYCTAWSALLESLQHQHGSVLDAAEKKTGMPAPIR